MKSVSEIKEIALRIANPEIVCFVPLIRFVEATDPSSTIYLVKCCIALKNPGISGQKEFAGIK